MPVTPAKKLPVKDRERFFVNLYISAGAVSEKVSYCEKRACLKPGSGLKILKRKTIQQEIKDKMEPVRLEQFRQRILGEAVTLAKEAQQQELKSTVLSVQRMKIDLEVLDHELMSMAVGLDKSMFPKEKLDAIKAAYVVFGTLESGNTRRLIPPEHLQQNDGQGTYTSLFNRIALNSALASPQPHPADSPEVFDLIPSPSATAPAPVSASMPIEGESIEEAKTTPKTKARVITVEIG